MVSMDGSKAERDAKIYAQRKEGLSLRAIAREFQLSVETVREVARRAERKARGRAYAAQRRGEASVQFLLLDKPLKV